MRNFYEWIFCKLKCKFQFIGMMFAVMLCCPCLGAALVGGYTACSGWHPRWAFQAMLEKVGLGLTEITNAIN